MLRTHNSSYPFVPKNFSSGISNLQFTITIISYWMSSNYLTLQAKKYVYLNGDIRNDLGRERGKGFGKLVKGKTQ